MTDRKFFWKFAQQLLSKKHRNWEYFDPEIELPIHQGFKIVIPLVKQLSALVKLVKLLERPVWNTVKNNQASKESFEDIYGSATYTDTSLDLEKSLTEKVYQVSLISLNLVGKQDALDFMNSLYPNKIFFFESRV